jgi:hypothetical protein
MSHSWRSVWPVMACLWLVISSRTHSLPSSTMHPTNRTGSPTCTLKLFRHVFYITLRTLVSNRVADVLTLALWYVVSSKCTMKCARYVLQHCRSPTFMTTVPFFDTIKFNPITRLKLYVCSVKEVMTNTVILSNCFVFFLYSAASFLFSFAV